MSALTLPGDIPGLLRRCSPVVPRAATSASHRGVVAALTPDGTGVYVLWSWGGAPSHDLVWHVRDASLDLGCPTGRTHAAWWLLDRAGQVDECRVALGHASIWETINHAAYGRECDAAALRRVVLHIAGRNG